MAFDIAKTAYSRVFLIEDRAGPENEPVFQSCLKAGAYDQSFGDLTAIECPDPERYGEFIEVATLRGAKERGSSSLTGRYAMDLASTLLEIARRRCEADVQVHFGACTDPRIFNKFTKALIWTAVALSSWSTEDLGALSSDENAVVNESTPLSIKDVYEVLEMSFESRASDVVVNEVMDVVICDRMSCGECEEPSKGCQKVYALQGGIMGSPGTPPDVLYSLDKALSFASNEIDSLGAGETADALACLLEYIVVVSNASCSLHYKEKADVDAGIVGGWTEVTTGFVALHCPNDIWSVGTAAFIVGDLGYVYFTDDPVDGVEVLDAGIATVEDLNAVHALDETHAVAVGNLDAVIYTTNGVTWQATTANPGSGANLIAVWMWSEKVWWVGTSNGRLYYTIDKGETWIQKALPGTSITEIDDISFAIPSVGIVCGTRTPATGAVGAAWRSYDGGFSWVALPEGLGALPDSDALNALALCADDVNFGVLVGEVNTNDGVIIVGED